MSAIINGIKTATNPYQMLSKLAQQNPLVSQVLQDVQANNGDAKSLFLNRAKQMGVDPQQILNQLR